MLLYKKHKNKLMNAPLISTYDTTPKPENIYTYMIAIYLERQTFWLLSICNTLFLSGSYKPDQFNWLNETDRQIELVRLVNENKIKTNKLEGATLIQSERILILGWNGQPRLYLNSWIVFLDNDESLVYLRMDAISLILGLPSYTLMTNIAFK